MSDLTIPLKIVDNGDGTYSTTSVIHAALPAGGNVIGKVGINQTDGQNTVTLDNVDIALSALRDALVKTRETSKTLADLAAQLGEVQADPTVNTLLARVKDLLTDIILAAGTNIIGKVGIDQTTDGTTNRMVAKISQVAGENVVAVAGGESLI